MHTRVKVHLTQHHISRGVANDCDSCPVALAIMGALPGVSRVDVGEAGMDLHNRMVTRFYRGPRDAIGTAVYTPKAVVNFVKAFDDGHEVEPFTFTLRVPDWATA